MSQDTETPNSITTLKTPRYIPMTENNWETFCYPVATSRPRVASRNEPRTNADGKEMYILGKMAWMATSINEILWPKFYRLKLEPFHNRNWAYNWQHKTLKITQLLRTDEFCVLSPCKMQKIWRRSQIYRDINDICVLAEYQLSLASSHKFVKEL